MGPGFRQDDIGEAMPGMCWGNAQHRTQSAFAATNGGRRRSAGESDAERPTIDVDADCRRHRRAAVWIDAVQPGPHAGPDGGRAELGQGGGHHHGLPSRPAGGAFLGRSERRQAHHPLSLSGRRPGAVKRQDLCRRPRHHDEGLGRKTDRTLSGRRPCRGPCRSEATDRGAAGARRRAERRGAGGVHVGVRNYRRHPDRAFVRRPRALRRQGRPAVRVAVPIIVLVGGVFLAADYVRTRRLASASLRWPTASGRVTHCDVIEEIVEEKTEHDNRPTTSKLVHRYQVDLRYAYRVGKRDFIGTEVDWNGTMISGLREVAEEAAAKYRPGKSVQVYYDPDQPGQAVLEPASRRGARGPLVGAAVCAVVGGLFLMILVKVGFA